MLGLLILGLARPFWVSAPSLHRLAGERIGETIAREEDEKAADGAAMGRRARGGAVSWRGGLGGGG